MSLNYEKRIALRQEIAEKYDPTQEYGASIPFAAHDVHSREDLDRLIALIHSDPQQLFPVGMQYWVVMNLSSQLVCLDAEAHVTQEIFTRERAMLGWMNYCPPVNQIVDTFPFPFAPDDTGQYQLRETFTVKERLNE